MPDWSKCNNTECDWRTGCYRFLAPDSIMQSYTRFEPIRHPATGMIVGCKHHKQKPFGNEK